MGKKEEKGEGRGGTDGRGMKGKGDNVGKSTRKEDRNDGGKGRGNGGGACCTYGRLLQYLRKSTGVIGGGDRQISLPFFEDRYRYSMRKLPTFYTKVTEFLQESYRLSMQKLPTFIFKYLRQQNRIFLQ